MPNKRLRRHRLAFFIAVIGITVALLSRAHAFEAHFGPGVFTHSNSVTDVKYLTVAEEGSINDNVVYRGLVGGWIDNRSDGESSALASVGIGLRVRPWIFYSRVLTGLAYVTHIDQFLGSHFPQFFEEIFLGMKENNTALGFSFVHYSNAGIIRPDMNRGRNFATLSIMYDL